MTHIDELHHVSDLSGIQTRLLRLLSHQGGNLIVSTTCCHTLLEDILLIAFIICRSSLSYIDVVRHGLVDGLTGSISHTSDEVHAIQRVRSERLTSIRTVRFTSTRTLSGRVGRSQEKTLQTGVGGTCAIVITVRVIASMS